MASTNPARGMRDFLPVDVRKREYVIGVIKQVYESYGYEPLETPAVENIETLLGKYGEEGNQLVFKILKRGEKLTESLGSLDSPGSLGNSGNQLSDLALRYDLTVPLARVVADRRNELPKFFKRYQIQPVWRADRPARGRFREFYQCDVDAIGSKSVLVEVDIIAAVNNILETLGFDNSIIRLNHRGVLSGLLGVHIPKDKHEGALIALDKLDKIGPKGVLADMLIRGIPEAGAVKFLEVFVDEMPQLLTSKEASLNLLSMLRKRFSDDGNEEAEASVQFIVALFEVSGLSRLRFDPSLARGLSYYTGTIMEINVSDLAGSLGGGGRYDGLIGMFGKEQIPACGFSLGLERILVVMDERGMFPPEIAESRAADVMVTIWNDYTIAESLTLADELRKQNLRVLVYPEADKLGKQIKYADSIKVPFVCMLGESELAENKVTLKNMESGEQETLNREDIISKMKSSA